MVRAGHLPRLHACTEPSPGISPLEVVLSIMREAQATKTLRARNCNRMLPIMGVR